MNVAVYSGSFNPLHKGHQAIIRFLTEKAGFDQVYLVVTPMSPFKGEDNLKSAFQRYEAALQAVKRHKGMKVKVLDTELRMEPPYYTIRTLDLLREREPENNFTLVIGADNLAAFSGWNSYGRILEEYGVVVFPRKGYHRGWAAARLKKECPGAKIRLMKAPNVVISSSEIREGLARGEDMSKWLM